MNKFIIYLARFLVGGAFVFAGVVKIMQPAEFAADVANYRMLPHEMVNLLAVTLPWVELLAGVMLIGGIWPRPSALVILLMTIVFSIAIAQALARGLDIRCGCFGTVEARRVGLTTLLTDLALMAMAAWLVWRYRGQEKLQPGEINS